MINIYDTGKVYQMDTQQIYVPYKKLLSTWTRGYRVQVNDDLTATIDGVLVMDGDRPVKFVDVAAALQCAKLLIDAKIKEGAR